MTRAQKAAIAAATLLVPMVLILNSVQLFARDWFVQSEYYIRGMSAINEPLAIKGLHSIQPWHTEGVNLLRGMQLPERDAHITQAEIRHMQDVRDWLLVFYIAQVASIALLAVLAFWLRRKILPALRAGVALTFGLGLAAGLYALADFNSFFEHFHQLFFKAGTWEFDSSGVLISLYPDVFWQDTAIAISGCTLLQGALLIWFVRRLKRRRTN